MKISYLLQLSIFSPLSRFSPPSLLGHPGLSHAQAAAAAAAGHHHLPQIKQELNGRPSHKNSPCKKSLNFKFFFKSSKISIWTSTNSLIYWS